MSYKIPCGRVMGHGECCDGGDDGKHICDSCLEINRLKAWIMRTASDDNLKHRAGYHGRRVMLEAAAVLNGKTIPDPEAR